jgi:hypothetical protein
MSDGYVTDGFVRAVERTGVDIPVTLLVEGVTVSGRITPWLRYRRWLEEVVTRVGLGGERDEADGVGERAWHGGEHEELRASTLRKPAGVAEHRRHHSAASGSKSAARRVRHSSPAMTSDARALAPAPRQIRTQGEGATNRPSLSVG